MSHTEEKVTDKRPEDGELSDSEREYPPLKKALPGIGAIYLAIFLIAIDRTILGTAIPSISAEFDSFGDIAWYEAGFLLPLCMLALTFGRIYKYYSCKWSVFFQVAIFELGSLVCATTPTSNGLIVGRVITGIGGAGVSAGCFVLLTQLLPLQQRPQWVGGIGAIFGIASIIGPILGGYLTAITWRWCFWINLPIGGVSLAALLFFTPNTPPPCKAADTWKEKIRQLDPIGLLLIAPALLCILFALTFGGVKFAWNSGPSIALFVLFAVFLVGFIIWQIVQGEDATVPPRIILQRSVLAGSIATIAIGACLICYAFYLPIWFQVIQDKTPQSSGLSLLPLLLGNVLFVILSGIAVSQLGYYTPFQIAGSALLIVGGALISTWSVDVSTGKWIGYQIVAGVGLGLCLQMPNVAVQAVLKDDDVAIGLAILQFMTSFGGTIFVTVAQALLSSRLLSNLRGVIPNLTAADVANGGATTLRAKAGDQLMLVLREYNDAIKAIWYLLTAMGALALVSSLAMEWKNIKKDGKAKDKGGVAAAV